MDLAPHTAGLMNDDIWKQWQGFMGLLGAPGGPGAPFSFASPEAQTFAPHIQSAERFTAAARQYFEQAARSSGPAAAEAVRTFGDFLRTQSADLFRPFWSAQFGAGAASPIPQLPEWPALGITREHQQRWQRAAEAAQRTADAQRRLQLLWSDALREAAAAFAARHTAPPTAAIDAEYLRSLYDSWIDCAEEAYGRAAHSTAFCDALAEFVNASSLWRTEVQASVEHFAKSLDLPTRSEINTLARRLKALEEQLAARAKPHANSRTERTAPAAAKKGRTAATAARPRRAKRRSKS